MPNSENNQPSQPNKAQRLRLILFGIAVASVSLFMYVSFILKTAIKGP